jgi:carboxypeptidase Q
MQTTRAFLVGLLGLLLASPVFSASPNSDADVLIREALKPSPIGENLERLTDGIGGRVTGTPAMSRAAEWGVEAFKAAGADSVHTENFIMPFSWAEGATEMRVVAPESFPVRAVSIGWGPALAPQHHVRVVDIGAGQMEDFVRAGDIQGTILLVPQTELKTWDDLDAEYDKAREVMVRAKRANVLAIAFQSTRPYELLYRHTHTEHGEIESIPMVIVGREDAGRMSRLLAAGEPLYADLAIPNKIGGPVSSANVIAELRGSEKPDEVVVLGAHLDSWELGTGALDNGCGAALVIDTLRTIKASGLRPKRTIRFILFSGEEQGLLGSRAYVTAHRDEMDKVDAMIAYDDGNGRMTGFSLGGRKDVADEVKKLIAPLKGYDATTLTFDTTADTDHFDFLLEGVPTLYANQVEANYIINYHAMSDTFDKVDLGELKKLVAESAVTTFAIADAPERVGPRLHRAEVEKLLHESHMDDSMKMTGAWKAWESGERGRRN